MLWKNRETGQELSERELEIMFGDCLDDVYGNVNVCGYQFQSAYALRELDPTAYRCCFLDWLDVNAWEKL